MAAPTIDVYLAEIQKLFDEYGDTWDRFGSPLPYIIMGAFKKTIDENNFEGLKRLVEMLKTKITQSEINNFKISKNFGRQIYVLEYASDNKEMVDYLKSEGFVITTPTQPAIKRGPIFSPPIPGGSRRKRYKRKQSKKNKKTKHVATR